MFSGTGKEPPKRRSKGFIMQDGDADLIFDYTGSLVPFGHFPVTGSEVPAPSVPDKTAPYPRGPSHQSF